MKILGVVFGVLLLLTGIALLAGSAVVGAGQGALDDELAKQGFLGPVKGTVTSIDQAVFTVSYTDKQGAAQTGTGPVLSGTGPPSVGDEVNVYYSTADPSQIAILELPGGGDLSGLAGVLRTAGIACLIVGGVLLLAGIIGLVTGRKARAAVTAGPGSAPQPVPGQQYPPQPGQQYPPQPGQQYPPQPGQQYPPQPGQQYPPQPGQQQMPPPPQHPPAS
jgi:hypothetical protein